MVVATTIVKVQSEIITGLLKRFPDAPSMTLAKKAYAENPSVFTDVENARMHVRYHRGAAGKPKRDSLADKSHLRALKRPGDPWKLLPKARTNRKNRTPLQIDGPCKVLILSDIHVPFHDPHAIKVALKYGKKNRADVVILNGDILDFYRQSRWQQDPREHKWKEELEQGIQLLSGIRAIFPKARIIFKWGNHEERYDHWMMLKAPELLDINRFTLASALGFEEMGIEEVKDKRIIRVGKLNVIHGHEYKTPMQNPVNPARGFFLRAKAHTLGGHYHQNSQHSAKSIEGHVISTWSTGALCEQDPDYNPYNEWSTGFAFVKVDKTGAFSVDNLRIIEGQIYR